jgi:hypothetical protein
VAGSCEHGNETSGFRRKHGTSWRAELLSTSQERLVYDLRCGLDSTEDARGPMKVITSSDVFSV